MNDGLEHPNKRRAEESAPEERNDGTLHPAWREFIRFCRELKYGEIERLSVQNGLPILAEMTKKKVRFT